MAREYLMQGTITDKCDVFSFGVVLVEVVCGGLSHGTHLRWPSIVEEEIDPNIKGKIAPECWNVFIDITKRCLKYESDERPTIGEIEVQLEHALSLQEQADSTNTNGDYALLSRTIINIGPNSEFQHAPLQEIDIEDSGTEFAQSSIFYPVDANNLNVRISKGSASFA
ncbi:hypothetical protein Fmac_017797 [Flemingia macrophylla]|uniref:Serine-threonine/tyrosine-protein kinase catalytic domain-containing protein n=1 Tax=Flemingia macrophylla TaxID=520843 RepID=A0ABD1M395_9FABA